MRQEMIWFGDAVASAAGTACKQSAYIQSTIYTNTPSLVFTARMLFLQAPNQQCGNTEGNEKK